MFADTPRPWPLFEDVTSDFISMQLHGSTELYNSRYTSEELDHWADCMRAWSNGGQPADARLISPEGPPQKATEVPAIAPVEGTREGLTVMPG